MSKPYDIKDAIVQFWAFLTYAFRKFLNDHGFSFAQSLTYTTIFAIIPVLAVVFSIFHALGGLDSLKDVIFSYLSEILTPGGQHLIQENLRELLEKAQTAPIGSFSILFFIVIASLLLMELEGVLNHIWSVSGHRPFLRRLALYWLAFTLGPVIMVIPLLVALFLSAQVEALQSIFALIEPFMQFLRLLPVMSIWFFLWATYMFLPNTHIKSEAAAVGTLVGGSLWLLAAKLYTIYNTHVLTYSKLYGSLGAIPIFLLWLFISWCIILYGAEVAYCCQYWKTIRGNRQKSVFEEVNAANILALHMVLTVAWRFQNGMQALSLTELSEELGVSEKTIWPVFHALQKQGILTLAADKGGIMLSKAPHIVKISDIWNSIAPMPGTAIVQISGDVLPKLPWKQGMAALLSEGNACFLQKAASVTLEELLSYSGEAQEGHGDSVQ